MGIGAACSRLCNSSDKEDGKNGKNGKIGITKKDMNSISAANVIVFAELRENQERRRTVSKEQAMQHEIDKPARSKENIHQIYQIENREIGSGHFGRVSKAKMKNSNTGQTFAIKSCNKKKKDKTEFIIFLKELEYQKFFDHPNIIKFHEVYEDDTNFHLVLEHCTGGEQFDRIVNCNGFSDPKVKLYLFQILYAVNYLHQKQICHRDLKPDNFLFKNRNSDTLKLIDFGLSANFGSKGMKDVLGSPYYMAPEVQEGEYDEKCDMWSVGVTMYLMISGELPFTGTTIEIFNQVLSGKQDLEKIYAKNPSEDSINLLKELLNPDYKTRISCETALNHCFFNDIRVEHNNTVNMQITIDLLKKIRDFKSFNYFQREIVKLMVQAFDGEEEVEKMKAAFQYQDTDYSGTIEVKELITFLTNIGITEEYDKMEHWMDHFYLKETGVMTFTEQLAGGLGREYFCDEHRLKRFFTYLDQDGKGDISSENISKCFKRFGRALSKKKIQKFIDECDENGDGLIQFEEFVQMMQQTKNIEDFNFSDESPNTYVSNDRQMKNIIDGLMEQKMGSEEDKHKVSPEGFSDSISPMKGAQMEKMTLIREEDNDYSSKFTTNENGTITDMNSPGENKEIAKFHLENEIVALKSRLLNMQNKLVQIKEQNEFTPPKKLKKTKTSQFH